MDLSNWAQCVGAAGLLAGVVTTSACETDFLWVRPSLVQPVSSDGVIMVAHASGGERLHLHVTNGRLEMADLEQDRAACVPQPQENPLTFIVYPDNDEAFLTVRLLDADSCTDDSTVIRSVTLVVSAHIASDSGTGGAGAGGDFAGGSAGMGGDGAGGDEGVGGGAGGSS